MVLIFTNKEDVHPTPVIEYFAKYAIPCFRFNTEALLTDYSFCWRNNGFVIKNLHTGMEITDKNITSVWDRRPDIPKELPVNNTPQINEHILDEAHSCLSFFRYYIKDIFSIGSISNDRIMSSKMLQWKIAHSIGMKVPDTCFSNRKEDIFHFAKTHKDILLKPIGDTSIWSEEDNKEYVFYAKKVATKSLMNLPDETFNQTISFIQNYVDKKFELRITVVCDDVFACKLDSQCLADDKGKIDWRQGYNDGLKHEVYHLPKEIADICKQFLKIAGLNFGCFDFIVTPNDEYVFLECNPNGQWLWIELFTGMKISESIAKHLIQGH